MSLREWTDADVTKAIADWYSEQGGKGSPPAYSTWEYEFERVKVNFPNQDIMWFDRETGKVKRHQRPPWAQF